MNVTVSANGRFWAFELAAQLHRRGHLRRLVTSYPRFVADRYNVPVDRVKSIVVHEVATRAWGRTPARLRLALNAQPAFSESFDRVAARYIPNDTQIFVGWSGVSERGLARSRGLGAVTVLERGSTHIEVQRDILREEYARWGSRGELPHPRIVEKELREYQTADYIVVPSEFVRLSFLRKGVDPSKMLRIPFGVDVVDFAPPPERQRDVFRLIYAGSMSLRKGLPYLLQAFSELRLPRAELWLVGRCLPEIEPFLRRYEGSFRHIPAVPQRELPGLYAQCSAFILCSLEEGFALVLPQAMASGLPVVCTENTGAKDVVQDGREGFILPIRDVSALKERIQYLYEHPEEREEMGRAARRAVKSGLTWNDYGDRVAAAYENILARS